MRHNNAIRNTTKSSSAIRDPGDADVTIANHHAKLLFVTPMIQTAAIGDGLPEGVIAEWSGQDISRLSMAEDHV